MPKTSTTIVGRVCKDTSSDLRATESLVADYEDPETGMQERQLQIGIETQTDVGAYVQVTLPGGIHTMKSPAALRQRSRVLP